ncbi:hypothetical protein ACFC39_38555, partial [Streptomyces sp. NPDC056049]
MPQDARPGPDLAKRPADAPPTPRDARPGPDEAGRPSDAPPPDGSGATIMMRPARRPDADAAGTGS